MTPDPYMKKDFAYIGWRRILKSGSIHFFREGISLCASTRLFADSPSLENGKTCPKCLARRVEEKRKAA